MFVEPMYAQPIPNLIKKPKAKPFILESGRYVAEEKFDGIRLITEISNQSDRLFVEKGVTSWSRYGNLKPLPEHIMEKAAELPNCIIDGELLAPGKRSYGTMDLENTPDLVYHVFDILQYEGVDLTPATYESRRMALRVLITDSQYFRFAPSFPVNTREEIYALRDEVWARDGEGLILKRIDAPYTIGKRPKNTWIKIKKLESSLFTIIGFAPSRGLINDRGPYGMTLLRDEEGIETSVKTITDAQCREFGKEGMGEGAHRATGQPGPWVHPSVGRKLWCEWQERTPDNEYRHLRWDHWD